jgi:hypothetical protein
LSWDVTLELMVGLNVLPFHDLYRCLVSAASCGSRQPLSPTRQELSPCILLILGLVA